MQTGRNWALIQEAKSACENMHAVALGRRLLDGRYIYAIDEDRTRRKEGFFSLGVRSQNGNIFLDTTVYVLDVPAVVSANTVLSKLAKHSFRKRRANIDVNRDFPSLLIPDEITPEKPIPVIAIAIESPVEENGKLGVGTVKAMGRFAMNSCVSYSYSGFLEHLRLSPESELVKHLRLDPKIRAIVNNAPPEAPSRSIPKDIDMAINYRVIKALNRYIDENKSFFIRGRHFNGGHHGEYSDLPFITAPGRNFLSFVNLTNLAAMIEMREMVFGVEEITDLRRDLEAHYSWKKLWNTAEGHSRRR